MSRKLSKEVARRRTLQWILAPVVVITIGLGWKFPLLGYTVPVVMITGLVGGLFRGRWVCGNVCPRGSLLDRVIARVSPKKPIPRFIRHPAFRWAVFAAMMGFMTFRIAQNPTDFNHIGRVFWLMCVITTGIGVVSGVLFHPRVWCSFCPMGTMQSAVGGGKHQLLIDPEKCRECRTCEKVCPIGLPIVDYKDSGVMSHRDCLKCPECVAVCPARALRWPSKKP